ncbi:uracil phosphoribosyltransferase [Grosmannia clavigera kw1407]|uniref:uracil phosphoribosyltransferase n=1 Tax=Grosmannia clavigera (strain kw1407 / UAMH 11150) TaxID=655863 RepID=F0XC28_GROCL|nr:uracil phosphoribosyltransferase [Grosmannia clavigera kw1407]EFX03856.1 uracil phosphoribosyltransferase [Grosmannia clavigera kw1407]
MSSPITVIDSPAFTAALAKLRDLSLRPATVRSTVAELTTLLASDVKPQVEKGEKIAIIVILRSGMAMMEPFLSTLSEDLDLVIYHLGLFREKQTLQPIEYYNKLPMKSPNIKKAIVLDPVVATGGTAAAALSILKDWGVEEVNFYCLLASTPGLKRVTSVWPEGCSFVVGAQDAELDVKGYVKPGVGDIGDRLFGTALD